MSSPTTLRGMRSTRIRVMEKRGAPVFMGMAYSYKIAVLHLLQLWAGKRKNVIVCMNSSLELGVRCMVPLD